MKHFKQVFLFALGICLLYSCTQKELDITMNILEDGDVKVRLLGASENPLSDIEVKITEYSGLPLAEGKTDAEGWFVAKDLLSGNYYFRANDVKVGNKEYDVIQLVQVITENLKEYEIHPHEFSATAEIRVYDGWLDEPAVGKNVAVFPSSDYAYGMSYDDVLSIVLETRITDEQGYTTFTDLPLGDYGIMIYTDENDFHIDAYEFGLNLKGEERFIYVYYVPQQ